MALNPRQRWGSERAGSLGRCVWNMKLVLQHNFKSACVVQLTATRAWTAGIRADSRLGWRGACGKGGERSVITFKVLTVHAPKRKILCNVLARVRPLTEARRLCVLDTLLRKDRQWHRVGGGRRPAMLILCRREFAAG